MLRLPIGARFPRNGFGGGVELRKGRIDRTVSLGAAVALGGIRQLGRRVGGVTSKESPSSFETRSVMDVKLDAHQVLCLEMPLFVNGSFRAGAPALHGEHRPIRPVTRPFKGGAGGRVNDHVIA